MSVTGIIVLLVVLILLITLIQQLGILTHLFAPGTSAAQRLIGLLVFVVVVVLIVWLIGHFLPALKI